MDCKNEAQAGRTEKRRCEAGRGAARRWQRKAGQARTSTDVWWPLYGLFHQPTTRSVIFGFVFASFFCFASIHSVGLHLALTLVFQALLATFITEYNRHLQLRWTHQQELLAEAEVLENPVRPTPESFSTPRVAPFDSISNTGAQTQLLPENDPFALNQPFSMVRTACQTYLRCHL